MPDQQSAEFVPLVSHEQVENAFWVALRMFVGRGKRHKACAVAVGAGVHPRTLDCYRGFPIGHPDHRPLDQGQKFSLASYIGADLTTEWLRLIDQIAYDIPDVDPDPGELAADITDDTAKVVRISMDRQIDANEAPEAQSVGSRMMNHGAHLVALGMRARRRA